MLFIFLLFAVVAVLAANIKLNIDVRGSAFSIELVLLGVIRLRRQYVIRREKGAIFTLYCLEKKKEKRVTSLYDIIQKQKKKTVTDKQKKAQKKLIEFLYKKARIEVDAKVRAGLPDAASTALCCGMLGAVSAAAGAVVRDKRHRVSIQIQPVFAKQVFSIDAKGIMALSPANIILGYILYKKTLRR